MSKHKDELRQLNDEAAAIILQIDDLTEQITQMKEKRESLVKQHAEVIKNKFRLLSEGKS